MFAHASPETATKKDNLHLQLLPMKLFAQVREGIDAIMARDDVGIFAYLTAGEISGRVSRQIIVTRPVVG
jgi:hypothetical protein